VRNNCIMCISVLALCLGASCHSQQPRISGPLFRGPIDATGGTSQSTGLIVPTNEANETIEQRIHDYVRGIQKFILERMPGRDVRILTDAEALQTDLSQNALSVYGTPRGNLWLAKYVTALPVVIEPNGITADRLYKGSDLRFISTWPHPQNSKVGMVIYTAQRAEDIVGINSIMHGPTDYVVAQGQTIVRAANYTNKEARWAFPSYQLDLTQATKDLDFLFKTIEQVHPNCRENLSKADYRGLKDRSRASLKQASDNNGRVPIHVLALTAAKAAAAIGDGHTACWLPAGLPDPGDPSPCMPPLRLRWDAGHIVIDKAVSGFEHLAGTRLVQIDGKPFDEVIAPVLACISGERQAFKMISFLNEQEVCWALVRPLQGPEITITVQRGTDKPETATMPLISLARYRQELPASPSRGLRSFHEFHHDGRTCYWQYNSCDASDGAKKAIDAVFKDIHEHGTRNLVIDLRFNGGGNSQAAEYILNYIASKPYCIYSGVDVKVSRQLLKVQRVGMVGPFARLFQGHVVKWRFKNKLSQPPEMEYKFDGSVYAIIGPHTFSAASDFAHVLRDFHIGTLVGEETGGLRQCFGDCPSFVMPHSGLQFSVSTKRWYAPIPRPDDATCGSVPDIPITAGQLAPFAGAEDLQVAFTLNLIERQPVATPEID
jgi:hypothetical protein